MECPSVLWRFKNKKKINDKKKYRTLNEKVNLKFPTLAQAICDSFPRKVKPQGEKERE